MQAVNSYGQEIRRALPVSSTADEQAKFLAGIPLNPESPLLALQSNLAYLHHFQEFGKNWQRFQKEHFLLKRKWAQAELATFAPLAKILYYFFSGPDFITATALFPNVDTYVFIGLEPVGKIALPETLSNEQVAYGLESLRKATETTLRYSFFITKDMRVDLNQSDFRGVLPILYAFIALPGFEILESQLISIGAHGQVQGTSHGGVPGIHIRFRDPGYLEPKSLYYFSADISNAGLSGSSAGLLRWLKSLPQGYSYLKAASYLLHENSFSTARDFLLQHTSSILQDDSGIPLQFFSSKDWNLYFYGNYTSPIELFQNRFQPDLRAAYENNEVRPLGFGTGYNWKPGESNLLLAVRKSKIP